MELRIAEQAGFCYGVKRALEIVEKQLAERKEKKVYILGPLIHNPQINQLLVEKGLQIVGNLDEVGEGILILPSHGVSPMVVKQIQEQGIEIQDATCPHVRKAQQLAKNLDQEGYQVVIIGQAEHSEIKGIWGYTQKKGIIVENLEDIEKVNWGNKLGIVVQTTQSAEKLKQIVGELVVKAQETKVHNTICGATKERQKAAAELAQQVDLMIVIGGYNSANTKRLAEICKQMGKCQVYHIEKFEDLNPQCLKEAKKIGLTAGASTPQWLIEEIKEKVEAWGEER